MAFPSDTGTVQESCDSAWRRARSIASNVKVRTTKLRADSLAGTMTSSDALDFSAFLADMKDRLNAIKNVAGIQAYAQSAINDPTINVATEFTNMVQAMTDTISWLLTNFPKTPGTNELRAKLFDGAGRTVDVVFSAASTSAFRTALDALLASIN